MSDPINLYMKFFSDLLDTGVPSATSIYWRARCSFIAGNLKEAERLKRLNYILHNSEIPHTADLDKTVKFAYSGIGVIIHAKARVGARSSIGSNVTIGGNRSGVPIIGSDVYIATGAKVLGKVKVGDGAIIGANSLVIRDVAPFEIVGGVPAKPIGYVNEENLDQYSAFYWCKGDRAKIDDFRRTHFGGGRAGF